MSDPAPIPVVRQAVSPPPPPPIRARSRRGCGWGCLVTVLVCALVASFALNLLLVGLEAERLGIDGVPEERRLEEETVIPGARGVREKIAVIAIEGLIGGPVGAAGGDGLAADVRVALRVAVRNPDVRAIVLHIDSPGGEVTASDEIYEMVRRADEEKPVVAWMGSEAASGGYYIACGARHIVASPTAVTGSIGVVIQTLNYEALFGKIGLEMTVFKSGRFKDLLSGARQMTPEEREYVQGVVMQIYDRFVGIVAKARRLPEERLRTGIADGRILTARDAQRERLIDELGYFERAVEKARELGEAPGARAVRYEIPLDLGRVLGALLEGRAAGGAVRLQMPGNGLEAGRVYLLPATYAR